MEHLNIMISNSQSFNMPLNPLIFDRQFTHIVKEIFEQLDKKSLSNCREVSKLWRNCINRKNISWTQIINIPRDLKDKDIYLHVAAKTGHLEMFNHIFKNEASKNPGNEYDETPFHVACQFGHVNIAELLLQKSTELDILLNTKSDIFTRHKTTKKLPKIVYILEKYTAMLDKKGKAKVLSKYRVLGKKWPPLTNLYCLGHFPSHF